MHTYQATKAKIDQKQRSGDKNKKTEDRQKGTCKICIIRLIYLKTLKRKIATTADFAFIQHSGSMAADKEIPDLQHKLFIHKFFTKKAAAYAAELTRFEAFMSILL